MLSKRTLTATLNLISSLTLDESVALLDSLSHDSYTIYDDVPDTHAITFKRFIRNFSPHAMGAMIGPVWFHGGPPGKEEWICGYVHQFVADAVLHKIIEHGRHFVGLKLERILSKRAP